MSIKLVTGNHPGHMHLVSRLAQSVDVIGRIREVRENFTPLPANKLDDDLNELVVSHFEMRNEAKDQFFGESIPPALPEIDVLKSDLNGKWAQTFLHDLAHLVISYEYKKLDVVSVAPAISS